ncbi:MAG TPA: type I polyketide synthase, partial [Thermoanaerobaculia bacterium]|nr:type I polyketide synthase [Thermoanaerobaculia bacterium]
MDRPQPDIALTGSAPGSGFALDPESPPGIALLSLALRVPGAAGVEEIWACHEGARETISALSEGELIAAGVDPARLADPRYVRARGVLEGADLFDPAFFGFTPREAELLDPQHRLLLEAAWEALESAGIDAARYGAAGHRIGVFAGSGASSYLLSNLLPNAELLSASGWLQAALLNDRDFLASRLAYALDLRGPAVVVQSACSTSLLAVHLACQSLLAGECDLAIAGGSSISVPQIEGYLFEAGGISSSDGHCRPFDARADGTVLGSGVGVAVLARAERALIERRPIRVLIRGTATNNDGAQRVGFTAPGVEGQAQVIAEALALAEVDASSIGYVEAHGSGTALGDPIEVAALTRAFRADGAGTGACALGSAKANHGHLNAAAGIAGLARAVLAVERATIPPALHFETPNPRLDLAGSPFYVPAAPRPWPAQLTPRRAGVSSFGLGGTNVHAVLEQAPTLALPSPPRRPVQPLLLSARTGEALSAAAERLADHLAAHPEIEAAGLADVAWTLAAGRHRFARRAAIVARDREAAIARLREPARWERGEVPEEGREVVFLFPGLGDQYPGMARGLYDAEPAFREELDLVLA